MPRCRYRPGSIHVLDQLDSPQKATTRRLPNQRSTQATIVHSDRAIEIKRVHSNCRKSGARRLNRPGRVLPVTSLNSHDRSITWSQPYTRRLGRASHTNLPATSQKPIRHDQPNRRLQEELPRGNRTLLVRSMCPNREALRRATPEHSSCPG